MHGAQRWSVMIPTYNPTEHLREAILSVQAALGRLGTGAQLEIVDDASTTVNVQDLLRSWDLGSLPVHRRAENGGLGACWNECIARAKGDLIHILHQDDLVKKSFYEEMSSLSSQVPDAGMYFCRTELVDASGSRLDELEQPEPGRLDRWLERICTAQRVQCASVVVRRSTYDLVGMFDPSLRYVIDWEMWIRIAAQRDVGYSPEALAAYRIHDLAETRRIKSAGLATNDFARALRRIRATLASATRQDCVPLAEGFAIATSTWTAQEAEQARDWDAAAREIAASLRYLGNAMGWRRWLRQLRWYVRVRLHIPPLGWTGVKV